MNEKLLKFSIKCFLNQVFIKQTSPRPEWNIAPTGLKKSAPPSRHDHPTTELLKKINPLEKENSAKIEK